MRHAGPRGFKISDEEMPVLPCLYLGTLETPLRYSPHAASVRFHLDYFEPPSAKILLRPKLVIGENGLDLDEAVLFECAQPGMLYQDTYYRFQPHIKRTHLLNLEAIRDMTMPEPLFGTFVENALPELKRFAEVANVEKIDQFVTLPFAGKLGVRCHLSYLDGELDASLFFSYDGQEVPALSSKLTYENIKTFVSPQGVLARNLVEERKVIEELFQDFVFNPMSGTYVAKTEKKIVEFMTDTIPRTQHRIQFECPQNLLDQFIYDETKFVLNLDASETMGYYEIDLKVDGALRGVKLDLLWECLAAKAFVFGIGRKAEQQRGDTRFSKILVLDLERISKLVHCTMSWELKNLDDQKNETSLEFGDDRSEGVRRTAG